MQIEDEMRLPGELVPEAAEWPRIKFWIDGGYIRELPTHEELDELLAGKTVEAVEPPSAEQSSTEPNAANPALAKGPHIRWHKLRSTVAPDCVYCQEEVADVQG